MAAVQVKTDHEAERIGAVINSCQRFYSKLLTRTPTIATVEDLAVWHQRDRLALAVGFDIGEEASEVVVVE